ncbi:ATP synthase subunit I [Actinobacillus genomosp. 2]|uniref:ATP synthase subunit I n=1 Tax=Actinobacillus genomosp. 2 TaxID=230709 RepID=UPI00244269F4|nr:ATP synthase subunit I [Actinobacillus genomosp. 2]WGE31706.1 ATP synthase subunit I [Actinobacillus genomosp. 2]
MSAVINKAKQHYIRVLKTEILLLLIIFGVFIVWRGIDGISFISGAISSFLPHCVFVYWIFFKKTTRKQAKMADFYRGEGIKWLTAILLVILCFKLLPSLHIVFFFVGYLVALFLNNVIPFILSKSTR